MANLSQTIDIIFNAIDRTGDVFGSLDTGLGGLDSKVQSIAQPLGGLADSLIKTEAAVVALGGAMVALSVNQAAKFSDSINEIGSLFNGTSDQIGQFRNSVLDYASGSTQSIDSINKAIYQAVSSGVDYKDSLDLINVAEKLSVAGKADLAQTTTVLVSSLNAYGESTASAQKYSDILFQTVKIGQTTMPELAASLAQVTGIASNSKVPFETLNAAIAALTVSGIKTPEAITGIRAALSNILQPSAEAKRAAEELGIQFDGAALASKGFDGVLKELVAATGGGSVEMGKFFGSVEGLNAALILGNDRSGKFAEALLAMKDAAGSTDAAFQIMSNNYDLATQKIANAAQTLLIKAGQPLLDEFGGVSKALAAVFQGLGNGVDAGAFDPIINMLEDFGKRASDTLNAIAANLPQALAALDFSGLIDSFGNLGTAVSDAFSNIFGNIDLTTPEGLAKSLQGVVNGIAALNNVVAGIIDELTPIFATIGEIIGRTDAAGESAQLAAGNFLGAAKMIADFGTAIGGLSVLLEQNQGDLSRVADVLQGGLIVAINAAQTAFDGLAFGVVSIIKEIVDGFEAITPDALGDPFKAMSADLGQTLDSISANLSRNAGELGQGFVQIGQGLGIVDDSAKTAAGGLGDLGAAGADAVQQTKGFEPIDLGDIDFVAEGAKRLGISLKDAAGATKDLASSQQGIDLGQGEKLASGYTKYTDALGNLHYVWANAQDSALGYKKIVDDLGNVSYVQVGGGIDKANKGLTDQKSKMDDAAKAAKDLSDQLDRASKERIAIIEYKAKVDVAQIQADAERVKAAFGSVDTSIKSTGDTLSNLVGDFTKLSQTDPFEASRVRDLIAEENKRRDAAFELQKRLVDEQIRYMQARRQQILRGDPLIKVEATNLKPALEMIFVEILQYVQVRANAEGLDLLLGVA